MNDYRVLSNGQFYSIRAHGFDVMFGALVFYDSTKQTRISAFKEWTRIDRLG